MLDRILVALDHSDLSELIFERAVALAQATGARLMLLHVLSPDEEGSPGMPLYPHLSYSPSLDDAVWEVYRKRWDEFQERNIQLLNRYAGRAQDAGVAAETTQNPGVPGKTICDLARVWGADLILMGNRGRSGLSELLLGSVSNYVTHHAPCSVMLVRPRRVADDDQRASSEYETLASVRP